MCEWFDGLCFETNQVEKYVNGDHVRVCVCQCVIWCACEWVSDRMWSKCVAW
jgi:hypothetical protein